MGSRGDCSPRSAGTSKSRPRRSGTTSTCGGTFRRPDSPELTSSTIERDLICQRTREGIAKADGRLRGRVSRLSATPGAQLMKLHAAGEQTASEPAGIGSTTAYRTVQRARPASAEAKAPRE